ncbi:MAG: PRC-barrel domain-containing protein [Acidimicrobiales bacterium]
MSSTASNKGEPLPQPSGEGSEALAPPTGDDGRTGVTDVAMRLIRASRLTGLPVVTIGGDHAVEIKDVVFDKNAGGLTGFTLRKPGLLGGPQQHVLVVADVHAIGPDAVMIESHQVFRSPETLAGTGEDVLGDTIMTDDGTNLGKVVDVVVSVDGGEADIVGFEVAASAALGTEGDNVFIPLPAALSISGEAIVVPASTKDFVSQDYTGFGASVEAFRDQLETS